MAKFTLTTGDDTIVTPSSDSTVYATAATLNPGDRLTGGSGIDTLALTGGGAFHIDELANFTGFEQITLDSGTASASLYLNDQPVALTISGGGAVICATSPANWNSSNAIYGGASYSFSTTYLYLNWGGQSEASYDLTSNIFSRVNLYAFGDGLTLKINSADAAGITELLDSGASGKLVTSDSSLDLSHTRVGGFSVVSTNGLGTTFTVSDFGTASEIAGGTGHDTILAQGFAFTDAQLAAIFNTGSIETIVDQNGTHATPGLDPGSARLTPGVDTVVMPPTGGTVFATAGTLTAGDSLTGGPGTDTLALLGGGAFHLDQLANFTGFEQITLDNSTANNSFLYLDGQPVSITISGSTGTSIYSSSPATWNAANVIHGATTYWFSTTDVHLNWGGPADAFYDLTSNTFSRVSLGGSGSNLTFKINSADAAGVTEFSGSGGRLITSDATLDLTHSTVNGFSVVSTNAAGTTFTVADPWTAAQVVGGAGNDTLVAQGFTFSAVQRAAIFRAGSIETIADASGSYAAPPADPAHATLTTSNDTVVTPSSGGTVHATAATLNPGDDLTGGIGTDILALSGGGVFHLDRLASFTGFEQITLDNTTTSAAQLYLYALPVSLTTSGGGGASIFVTSPASWNASGAIYGDSTYSYSTTYLNLNWGGSSGAVYDLRSNTFSRISLDGFGDNLTLKINSADVAGITDFIDSGANGKLVTSESSLDLSHTRVSGFSVVSTNSLGTTFTVSDYGTATQIAGGTGYDTLAAQGFTFTDAQLAAIFRTSSIETIIDTNGTHAAPPWPVLVAGLSHDTGWSSTDKLTNDPAFSGSTDPNATIRVSIDGQVQTVTADALGAWTFTPVGLRDGYHQFAAGASNASGVTAVSQIDFTLDTTPPNLTLRLLNDTGPSSTDGITSDPTLAGTGNPYSFVTFVIDGDPFNVGSTNAQGAWAFRPYGLAAGVHTITARQVDAAGNTAARELTFTLTSQAADQAASTADLNGDGAADVLWRNTSSGAWGWSDIRTGAWHDQGTAPITYAMVGKADLNGDGAADLLWRNNTTGAWGWSDIRNGAWHDQGVSSTAYNVVGTGDFNGDGAADVLWRDNSSGAWGWSDINSGTWNPLATSSSAYSVIGTGDFNGDGAADVLWRNSSSGAWGWSDIRHGMWHDQGTTSTAYSVVGIDDFNGDGAKDLLWRNNSTGAWGWSDIRNGDWHDQGGSSSAYAVVGTGDFNGDGFADVLWRSNSSGAWGWSDVRNDQWHDQGGSSTAYTVAGTGDYNDDGVTDILWQNSSSGASGWSDVRNGVWHDSVGSPLGNAVASGGTFSTQSMEPTVATIGGGTTAAGTSAAANAANSTGAATLGGFAWADIPPHFAPAAGLSEVVRASVWDGDAASLSHWASSAVSVSDGYPLTLVAESSTGSALGRILTAHP